MVVTINKIIPVRDPVYSDDGRWSNNINCLDVEYTVEHNNLSINGIMKLTGDVEYSRFTIAELKEKVIQQIRDI
ncbi:hypothetical protein [Bacillus sp. ISL-7]|uniref:hypothetical protein n=1 Tax=Bacillus sp. ISL-7 TaxID=2819136 RepID=UPI001BE5C069|nr:hypothetical protein [Bacillus sp. ISL-7]MBT2735148.1 hypothetical protein [Bacillus sp. ISL-7]